MRILILTVLIFAGTIVSACTTFSFTGKNGNIVFGRNFDFPIGTGHIEINKRNMRKTAFVKPPEKALVWVSKYGSITFNQIGKEFPYGGMNEAGLVIEQMWLQDVQYPVPDSRYELSALQWIQYQLDNAATVEEVIASDTLIRISADDVAKLHFLVADANGKVASIEFLSGKMVIHTGKDFPYQVLANCTYDNSLEYKKSIDRKENRQFSPWTENSSGRFVKAATLIENYHQQKNIVDYSFDILDSVAQPGSTQWSIVYDITNRIIRFKTKENTTVQTLEIKDFDFSCDGPDIYAAISDTVTDENSFREYSYDANYNLQEYVVSHVDFLKNSVP
ncbi:MAG: linear amide C-N hydrolase, partial [Chlorobi bacterium]|nr:linear amide C-N hydrolase [Chlorobiota bacterium]